MRGECNRGDLCPYRHEFIEESDFDEDEIDKLKNSANNNLNDNNKNQNIFQQNSINKSKSQEQELIIKNINNLKTGKKSAKSASRNKSRDKNKKLIESKRIESPKRIRLLMFKEWNEATSLFHFPLINKVIYKKRKN